MASTDAPDRRVRVAIVDDSSDIRQLLRLSFSLDDRYEIVGEAADGCAAVRLAAEAHPDLVVLDRMMPVMDGLTALPKIKKESPHTAVVIYTAGGDAVTYQAAIAAGAVDVLDKTAAAGSIADDVARILMDHWASDDASVEVHVGPVPGRVARYWVANTKRILAAVRSNPGVLPHVVPGEILATFERFLDVWGDLAVEGKDFRWVARASVAEFERLVENWSVIDGLSDEALASLGVQWSGPEGEPFFRALVEGVLGALGTQAELAGLARRLASQWGE